MLIALVLIIALTGLAWLFHLSFTGHRDGAFGYGLAGLTWGLSCLWLAAHWPI